MEAEALLASLNESQRAAVTETEGYIRVIAGAGTGKTRALTHRYAYLVGEYGISPSNILCITFTNKAANEMKRRIKAMLGEEFDTSFVATLHAFCTRVLREEITKLFYPDNFIVLDNVDQKRILEEVYDEMGIRMDTASFKFMIDQIRYYKNLITYVEYLSDPDFDYDTLKSDKPSDEIIFRYIKKQRKYFGLDFFDLINFVIYLFRKYPDVLEKWQKRLCYIMVDEFQDITAKEFKLIRRLTEYNRNLFVVGDPDQNIYEWRGASMAVIVDFEGWLNNPCFENQLGLRAKDIVLDCNYRSAPPILAAANSLIEKNENRVPKSLSPLRTGGEDVICLHGKNDREEITYICREIKAHREAGGKYSDFAVLYRSGYVSRFVEQGFLGENIPYTVYGGIGFYERAEIKDVLSYMRLVDRTDDDLSFTRIINLPRRKIGKIKRAALRGYAERNHTSLYGALCAMQDEAMFENSGAKAFLCAMESLRARAQTLSVSELLQCILKETGYELYIRESGDIERLDNVTELLRSIVTQEAEFGEHLSLSVFLQNMTLLRDSDVEDKSDAVRIMTIHTAKGLEFERVFLVGMTEGIFPSARSLEERKKEALEEERRLCFVAMTRAKQRLYLTESEGFGVKGFSKVPSRFLTDLSPDTYRQLGDIPAELRAEQAVQAKQFDKTAPTVYRVGDQIRHKAFGEGIVESVDEKMRTYYIRFVNGVRPISFDYNGIAHIF
ncbi:MAG: UvrD-helicase domain-containing protein [Clostridia bacterium]|nr:UvrD-helicase domain-containing protein [Clostridia bacterium]